MSAVDSLGEQWPHAEPLRDPFPGQTFSEGTLPTHMLRERVNDPDSFRPEEHQRLAESIRRHGIQEPIGVQHYGGENPYSVEEGHHRLYEAKKQGHDRVPVRIYHRPGEELKGFEA